MNSESYPPEWRLTPMKTANILEEWAYDVSDPVVGYYQTEVWVRLRVTDFYNTQWMKPKLSRLRCWLPNRRAT